MKNKRGKNQIIVREF